MTKPPAAARRFRPGIAPALILAAALLVRAAYLLALARSDFMGFYRNDHLYYREWALRIASGADAAGAPFEQTPLYAWLLGAAYRLFGQRDLPVLALQLMMGLLTVALVHRVARDAWGRGAAAVSGALVAVYAPFMFHEGMLMKSFLEPLLVMAALAAGWRAAGQGRAGWFLASGAAVGLACLVREVHALLLAPLLVAAWLAVPAAEGRAWRRALAAAALLSAFLVTLAPAALHNLAAGEAVAVSTAGGQNMYLAFGPSANGYNSSPPFAGSVSWQEHEDFREEAFVRTGRRLSRAESSRFWTSEALRLALADPGRTLGLTRLKLAILFRDHEAPDSENFYVAGEELPLLRFLPTWGWVVGLGLLGFAAAILGGGRGLLPAGFAAALVLETLLTFNLGRYRLTLAAVWLSLAGLGAAWLFSARFWRRDRRLPARLALLGAALALTAVAFRPPPGSDPAWTRAENDLFRRRLREAARYRAQIPTLSARLAGSPGDARLLEQLGLSLEKTGRLWESIDAYEKALAADPAAPVPRFKLADVLARIGEPARAEEHARAAVRLQPGHGGARVLLGRILFRRAVHAPDDAETRRLLEEAAGAFQEAVRLDPRSPEAHYRLGKLRYAQGSAREFMAEVAALRGLDPVGRMTSHLVSLIGAGGRAIPPR